MNDSPIASRQDFYDQLAPHSLAPLWERLHTLVTRAPTTPAVPVLWDYDNVVRPYLMQAGSLITAKEAERRVLILENPGLHGHTSVTHALFAGLQLILPGEVAPAHRHAQSALRFVIEGRGAYTAVEGERALMEPGDFIITPSWTWHDHGNEADAPVVWLDGLDIPIIRLLDVSFAEPANAETQAEARPQGDSLARYGANMLPVDWKPATQSSPVFAYPYARTREALATLARNGDPDPCHGHKLRYVNPATGGAVMTTLDCYAMRLGRDQTTRARRVTCNMICLVVSGAGRSTIGGQSFDWSENDIFTVPHWSWAEHRALAGDADLFLVTDRVVFERLDLWREELQ